MAAIGLHFFLGLAIVILIEIGAFRWLVVLANSQEKKVKQEINLYHSSENISKCPLLDFYIILSTITSSPIKFIVFESGEATVTRQIDIDIANASGLLQEDFISIEERENFFQRLKGTIGRNINFND